MNGRHNNSMDVMARAATLLTTGLFNSELRGSGFAPRHLKRSTKIKNNLFALLSNILVSALLKRRSNFIKCMSGEI
jgi:hypothetical protein